MSAILIVAAFLINSGASELNLPESNCPTGPQCVKEFSAEQLFYVAETYVERRSFDNAISILKLLSENPNSEYRAEARVRIARIFEARGDYHSAAYWFQQLLDEKPNTAAVRIELAQLFSKMGREQAARREIRRAEAAGLPREALKSVRNAATVLRDNSPFSGDFSIGIAPDTNVNSATSAETVDILGIPFKLSDDGRANSGVGLSFFGQVVARRKLDDSTRLIVEGTTAGNVYRHGDFNDVSFSVAGGPEFQLGSAKVRPAGAIGTRYFGKRKLYDFYGLNATGLLRSGQRGQVELTLSATNFAYSAVRHDQSGPGYAGGVAYDRIISPRLSSRIGLTINRVIARDSQFASTGYTVDALVSRDFSHFTFFTRGAFTSLKGDGDFFFFGQPRRDKIYRADAGLVFRSLNLLGLSPAAKLTTIRSDSIISLYRYRRLRLEFSLEKQF